jgi:hypothetical protein
MDRAQLPLSLVEVALGVVLILSVVFGFALATPTAETREPQLAAYADDTATILTTEPASHDGTTRLREIAASETVFERERDSVARRVDRILPANVLFNVETPHGSVGTAIPRQRTTGTETVQTGAGTVRIEVWYA